MSHNEHDAYRSRSPAGPSRASASPSNPFANLHPELHPPNSLGAAAAATASVSQGAGSGSGGGGGGHTGRSVSPNRLTDFAQHVLGVNTEEIIEVMNGTSSGSGSHHHHSHHHDHGHHRHHDGHAGHDGHMHDQDGGVDDTHGDAENLLAFTGGQESFLPGAPGFEGLMSEAETLQQQQQQQHQEDEASGERHDTQGMGAAGMGQTLDDLRIGQQHQPHTRRMKRRRDPETVDGVELDPVRMKKDSHKEVERRRRDQINDATTEIIRMVPGLQDEKIGKGVMLHKAAAYLSDLIIKAESIDAEIAIREKEKDDLRLELASLQQRLNDEHERSIRFETSWREAEDRAAAAQFELERARGQI